MAGAAQDLFPARRRDGGAVTAARFGDHRITGRLIQGRGRDRALPDGRWRADDVTREVAATLHPVFTEADLIALVRDTVAAD